MQNTDQPVELTTVANDIAAAPLLSALDLAGIQAHATGSFTADFRAEAPGRVQIVVRHGDLNAARAVVDQLEDDDEPIDWSKVDVGEPEESEEA